MSAFQNAIAEFLRLQAIETTLPSSNDDEERALWDATKRTDDALSVLLAMPAENGAQAAAELAAVASHYDLCAGGVDRPAMGLVVAECVQFLSAGHLADSGRVAA